MCSALSGKQRLITGSHLRLAEPLKAQQTRCVEPQYSGINIRITQRESFKINQAFGLFNAHLCPYVHLSRSQLPLLIIPLFFYYIYKDTMQRVYCYNKVLEIEKLAASHSHPPFQCHLGMSRHLKRGIDDQRLIQFQIKTQGLLLILVQQSIQTNSRKKFSNLNVFRGDEEQMARSHMNHTPLFITKKTLKVYNVLTAQEREKNTHRDSHFGK